MKVPETKARQERRERRIKRREEVAEQKRLEMEARVRRYEERRRRWEEGGRVVAFQFRGWKEPIVFKFSGPAIKCSPEEFVRMASLPAAEVARIVAEEEAKVAAEEHSQEMADKVLKDLNAERAGVAGRLYLSGGVADEN